MFTQQPIRTATDVSGDESTDFFSNILKPGSSLNPTFLATLDCAFAILLLVLIAIAFLTSGNLHIFGLILIELGLWGSVKWFVNELQKASIVNTPEGGSEINESRKEL